MRFLHRLTLIAGSHFPIVSHNHILTLRKTLENETRQLAWASGSREEVGHLATMRALCLELERLSSDASPNLPIHERLAQVTSQDEAVLALSVNELADFWVDALRHEDNPLEALTDLWAGVGSSVLQASVLLCFLRKNTTADAILESGLLHHFFESNCIEMANVSAAYKCLSLGMKPDEPCHVEAQSLLQSASKVTPGIRGLEDYALNGIQSAEPLVLTPPQKPTFSITLVSENWDKLYALFGAKFLIQVLCGKPIDPTDFIQTHLSETLNSMGMDALHALYHAISTEVAEDFREGLFYQLGALLNDDVQRNLFSAGVVSAWILLAVNPLLIESLEPAEVAAKLQPHTLIKQHIPYAIALLNKAECGAHSDDICFAVFKLYLSDVNWVVYPGLLEYFYHQESILMRCREESMVLMTALRTCIHENLPLTADSYLTIGDVYRSHHLRVDRLRQFSREKSIYPTTTHELQAVVIEAMFHHSPDTCVSDLSWLSLMNQGIVDNPSYTAEEKNTALRRTLFECLCFIDNSALQHAIIHILNQDGSCVEDWKQARVGGMPLAIKALLNNNRALTQHYFPDGLPDVQRLEQFIHIRRQLTVDQLHQAGDYSTEQNASKLLIFMRASLLKQMTTPEALLNTFLLYPKWHREEFVQGRGSSCYLLHTLAFSARTLGLILDTMPLECRLSVCNVTNRFNDTLLHYAAKNAPHAMGALLALYPKESLISALETRNTNDSTVLHCAISQLQDDLHHDSHAATTAAIESIWAVYPQSRRLSSLANGRFLRYASSVPGVLTVLFRTLSKSERWDAMQNGSLTLHFAVKSRSIINVNALLGVVPTEHLASFLKKQNEFGQTALHSAAGFHPQLLKAIFQQLCQSNRMGEPYLMSQDVLIDCLSVQDSQGNTALHSAARALNTLKMILAVYPNDATRLVALKEENNAHQNVLHLAASDSARVNNDAVKFILKIYPVEERILAFKPLLRLTVRNIPLLMLFLESIPQVLRLEAIIDERRFLNAMMDASDVFKAFLNTLSREQRFMLVKIDVRRFQFDAFFEAFSAILKEKIEDMAQSGLTMGPETRRRKTTFWVSGQTPIDRLKVQLEQAVGYDALKGVFDCICELEAKLALDNESAARSSSSGLKKMG